MWFYTSSTHVHSTVCLLPQKVVLTHSALRGTMVMPSIPAGKDSQHAMEGNTMSRKAIDETGNRYGRLTVLERATKEHQRGRREACWWCECDCGSKIVAIGSSLRSGRIKSCGCLQKELARQKHTTNLVGQKFGRLLVDKRAGSNERGEALWLGKCECGNDVIVSGLTLRRGSTKSCGCLRKERARGLNLLPQGTAAFNVMVSGMKRNAKTRGYNWQLTDEQVRSLTKQPCDYCGAGPSQRAFSTSKMAGDYVHGGIDRVDNEKGYTADNVVPCCSACNFMKRTMTLEKFKEQVAAIYRHLHLAFECRYCHKLFRRISEDALCPDCQRRSHIFGEN